MRLLLTDGHTAYVGRHFMDCVVRVNGLVYAARRVPVTIRDVEHGTRNPARPAYTLGFEVLFKEGDNLLRPRVT